MRELLTGLSMQAIGRGHRRMVRSLKARWPKSEGTVGERRKRLRDQIGIGIMGLFLFGAPMWRAVRPWIATVVTVGLVAWLLTALVVGQLPEVEPAAADEAVESDAEQSPAPVTQAALPAPADAARVAAELGACGEGVHLTLIAARLADLYPAWTRSSGATRALLIEAGVRVRDGVRVGGQGRAGVHRDDVPPLPSPVALTPGPVVVAGQSNNNNGNNTSIDPGREGFVSVPHPEEPNRTIVIHKAA
jgi:hypothetical protein